MPTSAEFEASDMEIAVRRHLGYARAGEIEQQFRRVPLGGPRRGRAPASRVGPGRSEPQAAAGPGRRRQGAQRQGGDRRVANRRTIATARRPTSHRWPRGSIAGPREDPASLLQALRRGFHRGRSGRPSRTGPDEAASELTDGVHDGSSSRWSDYLLGRSPQSVRPLEVQFNTLRGDDLGRAQGEELADRLDRLSTEVEDLVARLEARPAGTFGTAFFESLITIVREGVEVILVLAMLIALVAKATPRARSRTPASTRPMPARHCVRSGWGVGLAVIASLATAAALNLLVYSMQGQAREIIEGLVMLVAAGVLFYVSYWLVSQAEAKRWMDFLKQQARRGLEWGGGATLAVTAFLAVYREGAETSLMYQALLGSQGHDAARTLRPGRRLRAWAW